ncbi:MAG: peptide chain release factor N(5)-glutamine methyltransferase [Acidobacteriota bacterium]
MDTLAKARAWAAEALKRSGMESPDLSSDLLLGFAIGRNRVYILSHPEETLSNPAWERYRSYVLRHAKGEPIQYLTGEREFFGLDFRVTPAVLVPRPETEFLVEAAVSIIQNKIGPNVRFLDIGTGSGCIAISIAIENPGCSGCATDISSPALEIAKFNARRHKVAGRIKFIRSDLLDCFRMKPVFDLILCNPPYVAMDEYDTLACNVKDFEPHLALFGGRDGLDVFRRLIPGAASYLKPEGFLLLEIGAGQLHSVRSLLDREGFVFEDVLEDLQGIPRCLIMKKNKRSRNG